MAEPTTSEPVPSSSESVDTVIPDVMKDEEGPSPKKRKIVSEPDASDKLEHRLGGILCCAVCLDLPPAAVYQCTNGHLMCAPCFTHLLADARLRDEAATCPNCRVEISKTSASRNLAVEKTVSELPSECKYCTGVYPRHSLQNHEEKTCEDRQFKFSQIVVSPRAPAAGAAATSVLDGLVRIVSGVYWLVLDALRRAALAPVSASARPSSAPLKRRRHHRITGCRFTCIGCPWLGPAHEARGHEAQCAHLGKSAADVVAALVERERRTNDATGVYSQLLDLLSYEKITFNDLQLKPYRTEEFVHKLYYETSRFSAFGHQWVVKAFIKAHQRDPTQSSSRELTYQVILRSKAVGALAVQWVWLRGPYGEARLRAEVQHHSFAEDAAEAPLTPLPLADPEDTNRLLSNKAIHFRLIMFLSSN